MNDLVCKILNWASVHKRHLLITVIVLCIIGTIVTWEGLVKDYFFPKNFGVVEAGQIYRSGKISPFLIESTLKKYKIKGIISLSGDSQSSKPDSAERQAAKDLGIERLIFSLRGNGTGSVEDYAKIVAAICQFQKEGKPVLVHCAAGVQRTGGILAAYRLIVQGKDIKRVQTEMESYGFDPEDDKKLRVFLNNNLMQIAELLYQAGVIDKLPSSIPAIESDQ